MDLVRFELLQRMISQLEAECEQACQQEADLKQKVASKGQTLAALVQEQKERARQAEAKPKARSEAQPFSSCLMFFNMISCQIVCDPVRSGIKRPNSALHLL